MNRTRGRVVGATLLLLAALAAGACGGADEPVDGEVRAEVAGDGADASPAAAMPSEGPMTAEEAARVVEDSIYETRLMRTRQQSMDSFDGCIAKTKGADPEHRKVLEAACARSRGEGATAAP